MIAVPPACKAAPRTSLRSRTKRNPAEKLGGIEENAALIGARTTSSLLPRALLVAIRLQTLSALVLVHLEATLLFQISHGKQNLLRPCSPGASL